MSILQAIVLAIIEGLTEFLPVSSTGHMIIGSSVMGISADPFVKTFTVAIQLGAIASVVVLYWKRFFQSFKFYFVLVVAFIPAAVTGLLFNDKIDALLERVDVVGWMLIVGGVILLFIDSFFSKQEEGKTEISYIDGLKIGFISMYRNDPWCFTISRDYCRRSHTGFYKKNGCGILFFSCRTNDAGSHRLQASEILHGRKFIWKAGNDCACNRECHCVCSCNACYKILYRFPNQSWI